MIKIETTKDGAAVRFPFELKDSFRASFKSATWDRTARCWRVGPRSMTRLEQWVEAVNATTVLETLAAADEAALGAVELARLERELHAIETQLGSAKALVAARAAQLERIESVRGRIVAARDAHRAAEAEAATLRSRLMSEAASVADLGAAQAAMDAMLRAWSKFPRAYARADFEEAQKTVEAVCDALEAAGLRFRNLRKARFADWNHRERDRFDADLGKIEVVSVVDA